MDQHLPKLYREFAIYDNIRSFPSIRDGLKPVERRVLYTAYQEAGSKFAKSSRVDGMCLAKYHPHGTSYGTIVNLANQGFLLKQGNFGTKIGVEPTPPAAMRYTELMLSQNIKELVFKYIEHVPMQMSEAEVEKEPQFLPTMFPLCLLGNEDTQGIGTGFRTYFPCYSLVDLFKRLLWLLGKLPKEPIIKPKSDCDILSKPADLKQLLTTGRAKLEYQGKLQINQISCKAIVKSWPTGKTFESILKKLAAELDKNDVGFMDLSTETLGTHIEFSILKQRNRDKIFNTVAKKLKTAIKGNVTYEMTVIDENNNVKVASVDEMLLTAYNKFKEINVVYLKAQIERDQRMLEEYQNLEKIKPNLAHVLNSGKLTRENMEEKLTTIANLSDLSYEIVKDLVSKYRIQRLFSVNTDTTNIQSQIETMKDNLNKIDDFVLDQFNNFNPSSEEII